MNKAQKRTWFCFAISLATILIAAIVTAFIRINQIDISEPKTARPLGLLMTIPLILIFIISAKFPRKNFDERDKLVGRKANAIGIEGAFIFLAGAGAFYVLSAAGRMGSIRAVLIIHLVYLACFVWILVSSVAALIQYGWTNKREKS